MKYFLVLACALVGANAVSKEFMADFVGKVRSFGNTCLPEVNAQAADIDTLLAHKVPDTQEGKCLLFCIHKAFGVQKDNGGISLQGGLQFLEPLKADDPVMYDNVRKIAVVCASQVQAVDDPCQTAVNIGQCLIAEGKHVGITSELFEI